MELLVRSKWQDFSAQPVRPIAWQMGPWCLYVALYWYRYTEEPSKTTETSASLVTFQEPSWHLSFPSQAEDPVGMQEVSHRGREIAGSGCGQPQ